MPVRISALDRKLLRDLWEMKGQSGHGGGDRAGVTMFVTYLELDSLRRTRAATRARFARMPYEAGAARGSADQAIQACQRRTCQAMTLDIPAWRTRERRLISPERGRPHNDVLRWAAD
jgi:hypothetical protein